MRIGISWYMAHIKHLSIVSTQTMVVSLFRCGNWGSEALSNFPKVAFNNGGVQMETLIGHAPHNFFTGGGAVKRGKTVAIRTKGYVHHKPPSPWSTENPGAWTKTALEPPGLQIRACSNKALSLSPGHWPFPQLSIIVNGNFMHPLRQSPLQLPLGRRQRPSGIWCHIWFRVSHT